MVKGIFRKYILLILSAALSGIFLTGCEPPVVTPPPAEREKTEVSIIFDTGDSNVNVETLRGYPKENVSKPEDPLREGYKFLHWSLDGKEYIFTVFPDTTIILSAIWDDAYEINFDTGTNGNDIAPLYYFADEKIGLLPKADNKVVDSRIYEFMGWEYNGVSFNLIRMPQEDITLTAKWEETTGIVFEVDGDTSIVAPVTGTIGKNVRAPEVLPEAANKMFSGWYTKSGSPYIFDKMPSLTTVLVAKWLDTKTEYNTVSVLPKVFINLNNNYSIGSVNRETYVNSSITITNTDDSNLIYAAPAEFKGRGNGSWVDSGNKKGYRIKFFDKHEIFGEPESKHWVILACANFNDTTLSRTKTSFDLAREVFTNIEYTSSTNWVEVYFNGNYHGVYILAEHVRVDKGRVDIKSEFGVEDTGYLIEYDAYAVGREGIDYFRISEFASYMPNSAYNYPFTIKSPDPEDYLAEGITESQYRAQVAYIRDYTRKALLPAYAQNYDEFIKWVDIDSFVDMYILHEFCKNLDTGYSSFFMYKKPDGKLYAGPAWDFDASAGSYVEEGRGDGTPNGLFTAGSIASSSAHTASYLYINLYKTAGFKAKVIERWKEISPNIKTFINNMFTASFISSHSAAMERNFKRWPEYNTAPTWQTLVTSLKQWYLDRAKWLDETWV